MSVWWEEPFVVMDFETTGVDVAIDSIVQAAVVPIAPDGSELEGGMVGLVNPGRLIPEDATGIHGITNDKASTGTPEREAVERIVHELTLGKFAGWPVCMFNANFDWPLLMHRARAHGFSLFGRPRSRPMLLDPLVIDRAVDRYRKGKRTLAAACSTYDVPLGTGAHSARFDAIATGRVMIRLHQRYGQLRVPMNELMDKQHRWFEGWKKHINSYWASVNSDSRVVGSWLKDEQFDF